MNETRIVGKEMQEEILSTVRKSQAAVVEALETWVSAVQSITPELPDVNVPFADKLPKPQELVAGAYDLPRSCWPASGSSPRMSCTRPRRCSARGIPARPRRTAPRSNPPNPMRGEPDHGSPRVRGIGPGIRGP